MSLLQASLCHMCLVGPTWAFLGQQYYNSTCTAALYITSWQPDHYLLLFCFSHLSELKHGMSLTRLFHSVLTKALMCGPLRPALFPSNDIRVILQLHLWYSHLFTRPSGSTLLQLADSSDQRLMPLCQGHSLSTHTHNRSPPPGRLRDSHTESLV